MSADHDLERAEALTAARVAHQIAYAPGAASGAGPAGTGPPDLASLTAEQRGVIERWQVAEAEYDRLRRAAYERIRATATTSD